MCILFSTTYIHISGSPCLSFDVIRDSHGEKRELHPLCAYVVAGTQAPRTHINNLLVMKVRNNLYVYNMVTRKLNGVLVFLTIHDSHVHAPGGILTHDLSRRATADLRRFNNITHTFVHCLPFSIAVQELEGNNFAETCSLL